MDVLIVGGYPSLLQGAYGKKLAEIGVNIRWHEPRGAVLDCIPEACEGVIILKDLVNHQLAGLAIGHAKTKGIPFAQVTRKFSHAFPILRDSGFLRSVKITHASANAVVAAPTPVIDETVLVDLAPANEEPKMPTVTDDLNEAMDLLFLEDPYSSKNPALVASRLYDLTGVEVPVEKAASLCHDRQVIVQSIFGRQGDPKMREYRDTVRERWVISFISEYIDQNGKLPLYKDINAEAKQHLGAILDHTLLSRWIDKATENRISKAGKMADDAATSSATPSMWEQLSSHLNAATRRIDEMTAQMQTLLADRVSAGNTIEGLRSQVNALEHNVATLRVRVKNLEVAAERPQPTQPTQQPAPAMSIAQALAELASHGLTVKIEPKS